MIKFRYGVTFDKITDISLKKNKFKNLNYYLIILWLNTFFLSVE